VLSKLGRAVDALHAHMLAYEIADATQVVYEFWYGTLCDVYLEAIKPIMNLDSSSIANAATKHATQTVLHACLHYGLRMLHPFMPFVTEELYQRLQLLCGEERTSIMNAPFPVPGALAAVISEPAEKAMDIVQKVAAAIRSLRSSYLKGALEKHPPQIFVVSRKADVSAIVGSQQETICALAKSSKTPPPASVELVPKGCEPPKGCASDLIDSDLEVHILLKGVVDMSKEVTRLQKELGQVQGRFDKLKKKMDAPDYASKCPASQQAEDATKLHDTEAEITTLNGLIANFQANVD